MAQQRNCLACKSCTLINPTEGYSDLTPAGEGYFGCDFKFWTFEDSSKQDVFETAQKCKHFQPEEWAKETK